MPAIHQVGGEGRHWKGEGMSSGNSSGKGGGEALEEEGEVGVGEGRCRLGKWLGERPAGLGLLGCVKVGGDIGRTEAVKPNGVTVGNVPPDAALCFNLP